MKGQGWRRQKYSPLGARGEFFFNKHCLSVQTEFTALLSFLARAQAPPPDGPKAARVSSWDLIAAKEHQAVTFAGSSLKGAFHGINTLEGKISKCSLVLTRIRSISPVRDRDPPLQPVSEEEEIQPPPRAWRGCQAKNRSPLEVLPGKFQLHSTKSSDGL